MKTIKEWLEMLNEPERSQALENYDEEFKYSDSIGYAIALAFDWSNTKQNHSYWKNISESLKNNTYNFKHENKLHP